MQQYFVSEILKLHDEVWMNREQAHHIKNVMRMHSMDKIRLADETQHLFFAHIEYQNDEVIAVVDEEIEDHTRNVVDITLAQCLIKKDKWDFLLPKAAELGVTTIQPFTSTRCVIKEKDEKQDKKKARWNKILLEACEQCKRSTLVDIKDTCSFQGLQDLKADLKLIAYEDADRVSNRLVDVLAQYPTIKSVVIVIGCEGGFTKEEVNQLEQYGFHRISLGGRILRAETAAIASVNSISFYYEMSGDKI